MNDRQSLIHIYIHRLNLKASYLSPGSALDPSRSYCGAGALGGQVMLKVREMLKGTETGTEGG